jgi:1,2-diacylglycerol 3-alpha-glucosyltransferase
LDLLLARALLDLDRRWQPDVLHVHNFEGLLAALYVRLRTGTPVVYHVHNAMGLELHTYFRSRWGQWIGRLAGQWIDANLPQRADYCIVLNEAAVSYFQQRGVKRLRVIPPGIDFQPGNAARARQALGDGPLILYSGNLDQYQELDLLLQAFRRVVQARPDARLVFSTNAQSDAWQGRVAAMGLAKNAVWIQATDFGDVRDLLAAADVTVCPRTVCLGFPIKLLNYMAAGKAIVASVGSACGLRHLENGWIVADGDAAGMAEVILKLLQDRDLARRLGASARRTAETKYTWAQAAVAIEKIYVEIGRLC